ncbi:uncharacterized protein LOC126375588 [Pectinophora gossypiella]|uniref:uncharacterized protein LOC126375588 n=1 Tax=Pectinophora gossypiella TaxID=13191 RepID=UPI00214EE864|nr:uncharacterized protein LOC126375588 [Pectinophora gossypiella]
MMKKVFCIIVFLLSLVYKSSCIHCYYCNSANNSACIDLAALDDELRGRMIPVVQCETAIPSPVAVNFFCRKIVQTIFHSRQDSEVRVTRGCGWVRHHRECYRADNSDHLETVCQCFTDHCNSSDKIDPATNVALFLLLASVLYFVR